NDAFSKGEQSSLNRFVTESEWDIDAVNYVRLQQIKKIPSSKRYTIQVIDDTLLHKTGKHMEKAGYHRSGVTKKIEWGHCLVNSIITSKDRSCPLFPLTGDIYVRQKDCDKETTFRTKREMALEQIDYGIENGIPVEVVILDAGFQDEKLTKEIKRRKKHFIIGVRTTTKISIGRQERIPIAEHLDTLTDKNFELIIKEGKDYFIYTKIVSIRGIGKVKLIVSYKYGDEENIKIYITDLLEASNGELIDILVCRWEVECWHRDAKQYLGLEAYQVRKGRGIHVVVLAILVAYTLLILSQTRGILARIPFVFKRGLQTIGEICRFMYHASLRGWRWILRLFKDISKFRDFLNKDVLVKNAKV
ncbi:MAG: transposase, partial [Nanoarchaeota archaeon]|nr:transposase [Nanoarchaeota archaeon]